MWEGLRRGLPEGWFAWHSLRIRDGRNLDGEGDFVIAVPGRGLLVLEVKGGQVELRDGRWLQNGRAMERAPREQALGFVRRLVERLRDRKCAPPAYGVATCFPDVEFEREPGGADVAGCVLGAQDLGWLGEALPALIERALPAAQREHGKWIDALHEIWGESWTPRMRLGRRVRLAEDERIGLDAQQLELLDLVAENDRLLVEGRAGSGKTLLAIETARRFARDGKRVLLSCFTQPLAGFMAAAVKDERVHTASIRGLAMELAERAGLPVDTTADGFWEELPWKAATEAIPLLGDEARWDAVVIDEGQDFTLGDWALIEACAERAMLWAFHDGAQAFWEDRAIPEHLFSARFKLPKNYRCPPELALVADAWAGRELDEVALRAAVDKGQLAVVACPSESSVPDKVTTELDKLLGEGLAPSDIAIVSLRGQTPPDAIIRRARLGRHPLVRASDPTWDEHVIADTFLRFKGLERPAIIVTDLRLVQNRRDVRLHIAVTRALLTVRVVAPRECLVAEPVLARLT